MRETRGYIKDWGSPILAMSALLLTAIYAVTKESRAAEGIRHANDLASALSQAAATVGQTTLSPEQIEELERQRDDLRKRVEDTGKPGCIAAELTETARKAGLVVRGIQPLDGTPQLAGQMPQTSSPVYRIVVEGAYSRIGEYMDACKRQRLPARTRQFRITRVKDGEIAGQVTLKAEIVVEPFRPRESLTKESENK